MNTKTNNKKSKGKNKEIRKYYQGLRKQARAISSSAERKVAAAKGWYQRSIAKLRQSTKTILSIWRDALRVSPALSSLVRLDELAYDRAAALKRRIAGRLSRMFIAQHPVTRKMRPRGYHAYLLAVIIGSFLLTESITSTPQLAIANSSITNELDEYWIDTFNSVLDASKAPTLGPDNAPITINMFHDFTCGASRASVNIIEDLMNLYPDQIKLVFFYNFDDENPSAWHKAKLAYAAGRQDKFWEAYHAIFLMDFSDTNSSLKAFSSFLDLDYDQLASDYHHPLTTQQIEHDLQQNDRIGTDGSPNFIINNQFLHSSAELSVFQQIIDQELATLR